MWVLLWLVVWFMFGMQNVFEGVDAQNLDTWNFYYTSFWLCLIFQIVRSGKKRMGGKR